MTTTELKTAFHAMIEKAAASGVDTSKMEVAREYFTNPEFKAALEQFVWDRVGAR